MGLEIRKNAAFENRGNGPFYIPNRRIATSETIFGWRRLILVLMALVAWLFRQVIEPHSHKIEYGYSRLIYPYLAEGVAWVPRWVPSQTSATESVLMLAMIGAAGWLGVGLYRVMFRGRGLSTFCLKILANGAALLAGVYFVYMMGWGLNYLRMPFAEALLPAEEAAANSLVHQTEMARDMMALANALQQELDRKPAREWIQDLDPLVDDSIRQTARATSPYLLPRPPPTKILMTNELLSMFGVTGFFSPFFMEPHVNANLLPWELPAVMAHEKAHFLGFASEADANLAADISCLGSSSDHLRYSGAVRVLLALNRVIGDDRWQELVRDGLSERVKGDIRARNERILGYQRRYFKLFKLRRWINDRYLKANSQQLGRDSYHAGINSLVRWWRLRKASGQWTGAFDPWDVHSEFTGSLLLHPCAVKPFLHSVPQAF